MSPAEEARMNLLGRAMVESVLTDAMIRKAYKRLDEGLDAVRVKVFQHDGVVIADVERVDFTERRLNAELVTKLADHHPNKLEHEVHGDVNFSLLGLDGDRV